MSSRQKTRNLILTALCIALGFLLPKLFHSIGAGPVFLPMHIPVFLCGMICGPLYGLACGALLPLLSSFLTQMPPLYPVAVAMLFELAVYGLVSGFLYQKQRQNVYLSLILAMLAGRLVSGIANTLLLGFVGKSYGFSAFLAGAFLKSWPGILIQLLFLPLLLLALEKAKILPRPEGGAQ